MVSLLANNTNEPIHVIVFIPQITKLNPINFKMHTQYRTYSILDAIPLITLGKL